MSETNDLRGDISSARHEGENRGMLPQPAGRPGSNNGASASLQPEARDSIAGEGTSDERKNFPSASGYERLMSCPGSWQLERTLPPEPDSEASASGDRIHAYMEGKPVTLNDDEERVAEKFKGDEAALVGMLVPDVVVTFRERRFWLTPQQDTFSGKADAVFVGPNAILIEDYKSGWLGATPAATNPQLRALAVLVAGALNKLTPARPVYVAALLRRGEPTVAKYEAADIEQARAELLANLDAANTLNMRRIPGESQCRYCRAKTDCPEATGTVTTLSVTDTRHEIEAVDLPRLLDVCGVADKVIASIRAKAKRILEETPDALPGWRLKAGAEREKITDVQAVHGRALVAGMQSDKFAALCSITKTNLKDGLKAARAAAGNPIKGKALDDLVKECTKGAVEITQAAASLERVA